MPKSEVVYIEFASPAGEMLAAATDKGVCLLQWHDGEDFDLTRQQVEKRLGLTMVPGENRHLRQLRTEIEKYFAGTLRTFEVAIDVSGTPFEMQVWDELLKIPYGTTRSYVEIGRAIDRPGAARAVGKANGANPLGIVIPCHRVIKANGDLSGYAGKVWRKKYLLDLESGIQPLIPGIS